MMKNSLQKGAKNDDTPNSETANGDQNHKILKGALYLLDRCKNASRESFLLNGHRAQICRTLWPLILRVRCDKKSVNDLIHLLIKSITETYTTIEYRHTGYKFLFSKNYRNISFFFFKKFFFFFSKFSFFSQFSFFFKIFIFFSQFSFFFNFLFFSKFSFLFQNFYFFFKICIFFNFSFF